MSEIVKGPGAFDHCPHCAGDLRVEVCAKCSYPLTPFGSFCGGCGRRVRGTSEPEKRPATTKTTIATVGSTKAPKPKGRSERKLSVFLSEEDKASVQKKAKKTGIPVSQYVRGIVMSAYKKHKTGTLPFAAPSKTGLQNASVSFTLPHDVHKEITARCDPKQRFTGFVRWVVQGKGNK